MLRHTLLSVVAFATVLSAAPVEISPMVGRVINWNDINLENQNTGGLEVQVNEWSFFDIAPEISYFYSQAKQNYTGDTKHLNRIALNGVYDFALGSAVPFIKAGGGYEEGYENTGILEAGAGVKFPLSDIFSLKAEGIYINKPDKGTNDVALLAGLNIALGGEKAAPVPAPAPVIVETQIIDGDEDGVLDNIDECLNTPKGAKVGLNGCALDADSDGVVDYKDICLMTPNGHGVDIDGCSTNVTMRLNYKNNSAAINEAATERIGRFSQFMLDNPTFKAHIIGYTSSTGTKAYNQKLSERRAAGVEAAIEAVGVPIESITSEGRGIADPVASNDTPEGQALNRRTEVELTR
ncbi:MAG: OmpA family protein [Campylobacterota bacterium]|nr:OmpA family protein [Campylobacterota bacterium]